jgi:methylase of polypeptide subunit release factors
MIATLHKYYHRLATPLRSSKSLTSTLFGFSPGDSIYGEYWDWTTLALLVEIKKRFNEGMSLLDIGTGPYGILAIFVSERLNAAAVTACDHMAELIANALAQPNAGKVHFAVSDLFEGINGCFDCIVFNAPYMKHGKGMEIGVITSHLEEKRWSGGADGMDTIRRFLRNAAEHLNTSGICMLGVNHHHLPDSEVRSVVGSAPALALQKYYKNRLTGSAVYTLIKE